MIMAIPFAASACKIPVGPCIVTILEGPLNVNCTFK